jgi:uncharacterized membrane protein SpoIIM required for sporulation
MNDNQVSLAWIALAASILGPIALAIAGWIRAKSLGDKLNEVHTIVTQQPLRTDITAEIDSLRTQIATNAVTAAVADKVTPSKGK